jgi:hypothetical protein
MFKEPRNRFRRAGTSNRVFIQALQARTDSWAPLKVYKFELGSPETFILISFTKQGDE